MDDVSELRRLEAVRRDFVANLSHELKTPLGALSLLAETLDGEEDPEVVARLTSRVGAEATRFSRIVDDLLDLSRIEAGGTGSLSQVAFSAIITESVEAFHEPAAARGIRLEVAAVDPELYVMANRRDLVSAVSNLVDNAIKYSEPGGSVYVDDRETRRPGVPAGSGTRASGSRGGTGSGSSSAFTASTGHGRDGLVGPGSVWLSSATWPPITAATFRSIRSKGRGRLSPCACH